MANEIYSFITLRVSRGQSRIELSLRDRFEDMNPPNDHVISAIKTIDATAEPLETGEVANPKLGAFRLLDTADGAWITLSLNADGSNPFCQLRSGSQSQSSTKGSLSMAFIPLPGAPIYARADSPGRRLEYLLCEAA
jgi:hypothetical protein